jgi:hypothetical protein
MEEFGVSFGLGLLGHVYYGGTMDMCSEMVHMSLCRLI